jgi:hypothetical protein
MQIIVHLNDAAFQSLLIASIETFPSGFLPRKKQNGKLAKPPRRRDYEGETFGLLFGQRMWRGENLAFNVSLAVPMQTALRGKDEVSFRPMHFDRIRDVTESFPYLEFLGTFHSHPYPKNDYTATQVSMFSEEDEKSALAIASKHGDEILEVILGITALERHSNRDATADGETIQSYCGRFKYSLSAYCTLGAANDGEDDHDVPEIDFTLDADSADDENNENTEEQEDNEEDAADGQSNDEACLIAVDRLICPLAAHGGGIFARVPVDR